MLTGSTRGPAGVHARPIRAHRRTHIWPLEFYGSAIGKKAVMAVTGIILMSFVLLHMAGNLKIFQGESHFNAYAEYLREIFEPIFPHSGFLWVLRAGLIVAFVLHIHAAAALTVMNRQSRPVGYKGGRKYMVGNYPARAMRITGLLVGLFLLFHLFDLTWGQANPDFHRGDAYGNLTRSIGDSDRWWAAAIYIVAMVLLALHLYHGAWSFFQSLGWNNPRFNAWRRLFAIGFTFVVVGGNLAILAAILLDQV
jgi:succinate dehydrogenase / fumarate reductase cytochrome b subunit